MQKFLNNLWNDEHGFVVSSELIFVATLLVVGLVTGLSEVRNQVLGELADVADAISELDQSYSFHQVTSTNASTKGAFVVDQNDVGEGDGANQDQTAGALGSCLNVFGGASEQ